MPYGYDSASWDGCNYDSNTVYEENYGWDPYDPEEIYALDYIPFRRLIGAGTGYMTTQHTYPVYDSALTTFLAMAESATSAIAYEREIKFHKFVQLSAELRLKIYTAYLEDAEVTEHLHYDTFGKPCCVWSWPHDLIICDRHSIAELPPPRFAPWLPALAFANKQMLGEITICMLQTTEWFDFKYDETKTVKIVSWFADFLASFPAYVDSKGALTTEGFAAVKKIGFPHAGKFNECRGGRSVDEVNLDMALVLRCTELNTLALSFNWRQLVGSSPELVPYELEDFLGFFHFALMLEHRGLKEVHLEGVYPREGEGRTMECLYQFAEWIVRGFNEKGRVVDVYVHKRWKIFQRRTRGEKIVFESDGEGDEKK
ncbi:hypothetical protein TW65_86914 [Stemphylium lycopersici]|uniref:Uncharacterized protein n=1 Tax=Stemphylium lycopersici TaxID=183478 RepID=A0A364MYI0_STELY|nr:hypothetical protein TW65_86914 [Stemphylium lycopersici]RAR07127.1 hypothetical protein DDE83_006625 [Stemphylium lycopersici]